MTIYMSQAVCDEITQANKPFSQMLKAFAENRVKTSQNQLAVQILQKDLDVGESEAIVLAIESHVHNILIDEYKGRKIAEAHGLKPIGTIGILLQAKKMGLLKQVRPELDMLIKNKRRISPSLYDKALELSGEK